jgi:hypothetical protein
VTLQLEALLSIFKFQDSLMKNLPKDTVEDPTKKKPEEPKEEEENKNNEKTGKVVKKNGNASLSIEVHRQEKTHCLLIR